MKIPPRHNPDKTGSTSYSALQNYWYPCLYWVKRWLLEIPLNVTRILSFSVNKETGWFPYEPKKNIRGGHKIKSDSSSYLCNPFLPPEQHRVRVFCNILWDLRTRKQGYLAINHCRMSPDLTERSSWVPSCVLSSSAHGFQLDLGQELKWPQQKLHYVFI